MPGSTNVGSIDLSLILNSSAFQNQLRNVVRQANQASNKMTNAFDGLGKAIAAAFSVKVVADFGKACVNAYSDMTNAWVGLKSILTGQGRDFQVAQGFLQDYVSDGLVPLNNAVTAYKNLASRGYNTQQIEAVMTAFKNSATFARQSSYTLGEAIQTASEGLKNENSILVDNVGVTKNVSKMWEDYAKAIGKTRNGLTQQEKIQAEVNGILEETQFQMHDAEIYTQTYSGKVAVLNSAFTTMKASIGNVLQPIVGAFIPILTKAANAVTNLFNSLAKLLALFGVETNSKEKILDKIDDVVTSSNNASKAIEGIGDSASKTAKELKKSLAGFDEMNVLSDTSSSGSGGSGSGGAGMDISALTEGKDPMIHLEEDTRLLDMLKAKVQELKNIFKSGFELSFGETNFNGILEHLQNIKKAMLDIGTDSRVINSAKNFTNTLLFSLGQVTGAIGRIGTNIAEGLIGSIDSYLSQNTERIKNFIINMFNIGSEEFAFVGNFSQAIGKISDVFKSDTVKQIGADIIAVFVNAFMSALQIVGGTLKDVTGILVQPIIDNVDTIKEALENSLQPVRDVTNKSSNGLTSMFDNLVKTYDEKIKPMFDNIKQGLSDSFGKFLEVYNTYVAPILELMSQKFAEVWDSKIQPMLDNFVELMGLIGETISALWDTILKPTLDWLIKTLTPIITKVFKFLWDSLMDFFGFVSDTINGIIKIFKGILDFVVGVFTGDWKRAWEGIKEFFIGIWETIKGAIMSIVTGVTTIIGAMISGLIIKFTFFAGKVKAIFETIAVIFKSIWEGISTTISNAWNFIVSIVKNGVSGAWNAITSVFGNIAEWFKNKFTEAWQAVKNVFSSGGKIFDGIKEGILSGLKTIVNAIISGINKVISIPFNGINSALKSIKNVDILGLKPFNWIKTINVPQIPKLAQGGFVKANTPQLAIIGDNKTQGEIVAPEDKMLDMIMKALKLFNEQNNNNVGNNSGDIILNNIMDGEVVQRRIYKRNDLLTLATNGRSGL